MRKADLDFITMVVRDLMKRGMGFRLHNQLKVDSDGSTGWNNEDELFVATKRPQLEWIPILAHEYAHILIDDEGSSPIDDKHLDIVNIENDTHIGAWLETPIKQRITACKAVQKYEHTVETRSRELLIQYNLTHNQERESRHGNAYILMYTIGPYLPSMIWGKKPLGHVKSISRRMPSSRLMPLEWFNKPIEELQWMVREVILHCIKKETLDKIKEMNNASTKG